ncbi:hypothetical protein RRG08_056876 [Elysia crispata]|uniref:Uncharacterized protein n=1 Tax=Elysia crispata TaxID=231223 RepID=A0AAE0ZCA2_9GAST|nr:hypothetical protein RRG08_056876 [Elysia crispata]
MGKGKLLRVQSVAGHPGSFMGEAKALICDTPRLYSSSAAQLGVVRQREEAGGKPSQATSVVGQWEIGDYGQPLAEHFIVLTPTKPVGVGEGQGEDISGRSSSVQTRSSKPYQHRHKRSIDEAPAGTQIVTAENRSNFCGATNKGYITQPELVWGRHEDQPHPHLLTSSLRNGQQPHLFPPHQRPVTHARKPFSNARPLWAAANRNQLNKRGILPFSPKPLRLLPTEFKGLRTRIADPRSSMAANNSARSSIGFLHGRLVSSGLAYHNRFTISEFGTGTRSGISCKIHLLTGLSSCACVDDCHKSMTAHHVLAQAPVAIRAQMSDSAWVEGLGAHTRIIDNPPPPHKGGKDQSHHPVSQYPDQALTSRTLTDHPSTTPF